LSTSCQSRRPTADNGSRSPSAKARRPAAAAAGRLAVMPAAHARKQQKLTYGSAYRQLIAATDSPQLDGKPHASLDRSQKQRQQSRASYSVYYIMQSTD